MHATGSEWRFDTPSKNPMMQKTFDTVVTKGSAEQSISESTNSRKRKTYVLNGKDKFGQVELIEDGRISGIIGLF